MPIQERKSHQMRPHVEVRPYPINSANDDLEYDEATTPLYHVFVSQSKLKMLFVVAQIRNKREYEVLRCEYVTLHGMDERDIYLNIVDTFGISADSTIVNEVFEFSLKPFGLKLLDATFHNFEFFESAIEGKGFVFEDAELYNSLKNFIARRCNKMLQDPYVMEY